MKWSKDEIDYLKNNYQKLDKNTLLNNLPLRSWSKIKDMSKRLKLKRSVDCIKWTKEEIDYLINNYENEDKQILLNNLPLRNWNTIISKSCSLKLKRYNDTKRYANMNILLEDINETYYWIGFIMSDGHIENNNRLTIRLSEKDKEHLEKFKKFIKYYNNKERNKKNGNYKKFIGVSIMDTKYLKKLCDKFNIKHNKTYVPCDISNIKNDDLLLSLIVGFIDGDGGISHQTNRKDFRLTVKCHKNWSENLEYMLNAIFRITGENCKTSIKPTKCKRYSLFCITDTSVLKKLKQRVLDLGLPYMERKWDVIDMKYDTFYEKSKNKKLKFLELINENKDICVKDLCLKLNLKIGSIYKYKRLLKL